MLRMSLVVLAASLIGSIPVSAKTFTGSCTEWCMKNNCRTSISKNRCMPLCVQACLQKNPNAKN